MGLSNLTYFAKGGGCFLAGTMVSTPMGDRAIESLRRGDRVISFNESTQQQEISTIGEIDVLQRDTYFRINSTVNATAEHPFYTSDGIKKVKNLKVGDKLIHKDGSEVEITSLIEVKEDVAVYNLLNVTPNNNYFANNFLVHNKGGGCFLADTEILVSLEMNGYGDTRKIQELEPGDNIVSYNEETGKRELSSIEKIDKLVSESYYILNGGVRATGEHPFYTSEGIKKVKDLRIGDLLTRWGGNDEALTSIQYIEEDVVIYNIINVEPNHNYYADYYLVHNKGGGGGCFLAGTQVTMKTGNKAIEDVKGGDQIWTLNEKTHITELAKVSELQVLEMPGYYIINDEIKTTEGHPFYTTDGIKKVVDLEVGDVLLKNFDIKTTIKTIRYVEETVTVYNLLNVEPNHNYLANGYLVHNKGGSSSGGHSSSSSSGGKSSSSSSSSSSSASSAPKAGTSTAKPGAKVKGADGKEVTSSTKTPSKSDFKTSTGVVGDNGYSPRFQGGYSAPAGSVVYQRDNNIMDYFFLAYLFNGNNSARPENQQTVIVQPDGKEVTAKPVTEGTDGMMVLNWIIFGVFCIAIVGGVIWAVNKWTNR